MSSKEDEESYESESQVESQQESQASTAGQCEEHITAAGAICGCARLLGIDPVNEPQYLWVCEEALNEPADGDRWKDWAETEDQHGETVYYNRKTKKIAKVHPIIETYMEMYKKQKSYTKMMTTMPGAFSADTGGDSKLTRIIQDVMTRKNHKLPVANPDIVERLCHLVKVDATREYYLVRCVKQTLEAYIEKSFDLQNFVEDLKGPLQDLRKIRQNQTKVDVIKKPETVIMCQECDEKSAVVRCEQCEDFFCQDCFNALHATGKRRGHITADVEQLVCAACDETCATCQCIQCGLFYCDACFVTTHESRPELHNHLKRMLNGLVCLECEHYNASVLCEDCVDLFCTECFIKLHRKGSRRRHFHLTIDNAGQIFRGGHLVSPEETQLLTDRARATQESGPWLAFKDDNLQVYWYHLASRTTITPETVKQIENKALEHGVSATEQMKGFDPNVTSGSMAKTWQKIQKDDGSVSAWQKIQQNDGSATGSKQPQFVKPPKAEKRQVGHKSSPLDKVSSSVFDESVTWSHRQEGKSDIDMGDISVQDRRNVSRRA